MLTPGMRQAAQISNTSAAQIQQQFDKIGSGGKRMGASVDELRKRLEAVNRVRFGTTIQKEFDTATRAANKLERQISQIENKGRGGSGFGMIGGMLTGFAALGLGKNALGKAAEREQQNISFGVMTGSQKTGTKMVNDLVAMGAATPYESADLIKNAQTLKAFGIENEKVLPVLRTIGDIASGDAQKLSSLSLAFAQTSSAGRLTGQDLLQMVNAGFNPLQQMVKDKVFPSMQMARKAMEEGAIGANMVEAAFKSATGPGGQFHLMMEKQSQTLQGRWSTFMDNVNMKLMAFGERLMPVANKLLDFGSAMLQGEPWAIALAGAIGLVTLSLTWASAQAFIYGAVTRSVTFFTNLWAGAQAFLNASLWANPITWVVAGIIALIAVIGYVIYKTDGWGKQWDSIIKFFKHSWAAFKDYFYLVWLELQDSFMTGLELIEKGWYKLKMLWDKEGANEGLNKISNQQSQRAAEIAKARGVLQSDVEAANNALKWELKWNDKDPVAAMKKKFGLGAGVNPVAATSGGTGGANYGSLAGGKGKAGLGSTRADSINNGGQKSIVINIGKIGEKIEQHIVGGTKEAAEEFSSMMREEILRTLYSLNGAV